MSIMSYKEITINSYQATAEAYAKNVADLAPLTSIERFVQFLSGKGTVLDLGCGSGRDTKLLSEKGLQVTGIDLSTNMLKIAKKSAPLAHFEMMDVEALEMAHDSLDGVWAGCTLSHIPKKILPSVLHQIHTLLKPGGTFYLTLRHGSKEGLEKDTRYEGSPEKYWAYYEEEEIQKLLHAFRVLECCPVFKAHPAYQTVSCLRLFCQKE